MHLIEIDKESMESRREWTKESRREWTKESRREWTKESRREWTKESRREWTNESRKTNINNGGNSREWDRKGEGNSREWDRKGGGNSREWDRKGGGNDREWDRKDRDKWRDLKNLYMYTFPVCKSLDTSNIKLGSKLQYIVVMFVLVLCSFWCYVRSGVMFVLVLCSFWCYVRSGVMVILVLYSFWCYVRSGVMVMCSAVHGSNGTQPLVVNRRRVRSSKGHHHSNVRQRLYISKQTRCEAVANQTTSDHNLEGWQ